MADDVFTYGLDLSKYPVAVSLMWSCYCCLMIIGMTYYYDYLVFAVKRFD